jgi:hypothetical protein
VEHSMGDRVPSESSAPRASPRSRTKTGKEATQRGKEVTVSGLAGRASGLMPPLDYLAAQNEHFDLVGTLT